MRGAEKPRRKRPEAASTTLSVADPGALAHGKGPREGRWVEHPDRPGDLVWVENKGAA